jgi:hypothetical protein
VTVCRARCRRALLRAGAAAALLAATGAWAGDEMTETFENGPERRWRFFTDGVMGGVSSGAVAFERQDGRTHARMTGRVSTANRGGFIQMRMDLAAPPLAGTAGVRLVVRGNGERYFVHLRTSGTVLPWQFHQAGFETTGDWTEVRLPFEGFRPSGGFVARVPRPESVTSLAVAAYGRDHAADVAVREIGFY